MKIVASQKKLKSTEYSIAVLVILGADTCNASSTLSWPNFLEMLRKILKKALKIKKNIYVIDS